MGESKPGIFFQFRNYLKYQEYNLGANLSVEYFNELLEIYFSFNLFVIGVSIGYKFKRKIKPKYCGICKHFEGGDKGMCHAHHETVDADYSPGVCDFKRKR